jgi:Fic family protein
LDGALNRLFEQSLLALGRLDNITTLLPDTALFLYTYVRKEAVLSSQIEGTQSSLSDLLLYELEETPGVPVDDAKEVVHYVAALDHGLKRLREGFPVSNRLIREIHGILLSGGRGSDKSPGEFRRSQNWVGGTRPGNALFVPPPPQYVSSCMSDLEKFLHDKKKALPVLVTAALAHVQFETIHPFLDGNGRVGRLVITLLLCAEGILREPLLYLSLYFKENRSEYYRLLGIVRSTGEWEAWLEFFLTGIRETADAAVRTAQRLVALFEKDRERIQEQGRAAGSALRVLEALMQRPILSQPQVAKMTQLSPPTVASTLRLLENMNIAKELTEKQRNKLFGYSGYLAILSEGTEPVS